MGDRIKGGARLSSSSKGSLIYICSVNGASSLWEVRAHENQCSSVAYDTYGKNGNMKSLALRMSLTPVTPNSLPGTHDIDIHNLTSVTLL